MLAQQDSVPASKKVVLVTGRADVDNKSLLPDLLDNGIVLHCIGKSRRKVRLSRQH